MRAGTIKLDSKIGCSELAYLQPPSKVGLPVGAEMTVETALQALIVKSANDVAVMLAEGVAGSQEAFVARMNATAARLGMTRTKFVNPNGLPAPEQVTTARDLAKLAQAVIRDYPEHAPYWSQIDVKVGKRRLRTHNGLLTNYEGADGLKTGFICDSGFNVVATATREGRKLIAVVLGEPTGRERTVRAASLLEHGFQTYGWKALFDPQKLDTMPMALGAKGPVTMRQAVISFECGTRRRRRRQEEGRQAEGGSAEQRCERCGRQAGAEQAEGRAQGDSRRPPLRPPASSSGERRSLDPYPSSRKPRRRARLSGSQVAIPALSWRSRRDDVVGRSC